MPARDLTEELKKRSAWSILMGVFDRSSWDVPHRLPVGNCDDHDCSAGLGLDLRGYRSVCFCALLANGRELLPEDSLEPALWNLRYRIGVLSGCRGGGLDPDARNVIADSSRNAYCYCVATETSGRLGLVFGGCCNQLTAGRSDFREVALQRDLDNWDAGWCGSAAGRNCEDRDRNQDTEWRRHDGTTFASGVAEICAAGKHRACQAT